MIQVFRPPVAVAAPVAPAGKYLRPAVRFVLRAVGRCAPSLSQGMPLVRRQPRVIPPTMLGSALTAAGIARAGNSLSLASEEAFSRLGTPAETANLHSRPRWHGPKVSTLAKNRVTSAAIEPQPPSKRPPGSLPRIAASHGAALRPRPAPPYPPPPSCECRPARERKTP